VKRVPVPIREASSADIVPYCAWVRAVCKHHKVSLSSTKFTRWGKTLATMEMMKGSLSDVTTVASFHVYAGDEGLDPYWVSTPCGYVAVLRTSATLSHKVFKPLLTSQNI